MIATRHSSSKMALVFLAVTAAIWALSVGPAEAAIDLVDTDYADTTTTGASGDFTLTDEGGGTRDGIYSYSYNAGASFDMLVVTVSREASTGVPFGVSYGGVAMTLATGATDGSGVSIFYLETTATSGIIALDFRNFATVNGIGIGIAAIKSDNGDPITLHAANSGTGTSISIDTADGSFTLWAIDTNLGAFTDLPETQIIKDEDIGSNGYAAAHKLVTTGQTGETYSYVNTTASPNGPRGIAAANFKPDATPDTTAPELAAVDPLNPADGAANVSVSGDLVATFNETIQLTGVGSITITDLDDDSSSVTINLPDADQVSVSGADLTINPTLDLEPLTHYSVRISDDAIEDTASSPNTFAGILDDTTWDFTTAAPDFVDPELNSSDIEDGLEGIPASKNKAISYTLTFSEPMNITTLGNGLSNASAGGPSITIGTIVENGNVYTVPVTPTSAGSLRLQVAGTVEDVAGNTLGSDVLDEETITVIDGTMYVWTGTDSNSLNVDNNWAGGTQPTGIGADQPSTPSIDDILVFDSTTWVRAPRTLYTRTDRKWGSIVVKNGTVTWASHSNNQGNYSWGGTDTLVVGDGVGAANSAICNFNVQRWNHGGTTGTKTYVIDSDGHLVSNRGGTHTWSNGANYDTVMRLIGGRVTIVGSITETELTGDAGDYVIFEAVGSTFTASFGASGAFPDLATVQSHMGTNLSFRGTDKVILTATDNLNGTFTISAGLKPQGSVIRFR